MNWLNPYAHKNVAERLIPLIGTGMKQYEAAAVLGCSTAAVSKALKRMGATMNPEE